MIVKQYFILVLSVVFFGCGTTNVYQVVKLETKEKAQYGKLTDSIDIVTNHWGEGGILDLVINNNSSEILNLDLANSFLVKDGVSIPLGMDLDIKFAIAPKSKRVFLNPNVLSSQYFKHCDLKFYGDSTQHIFFNSQNSLLSYYYYLTFVDGYGNIYRVKTNNYYLSELYGVSESSFLRREYLQKCGNVIYKENGEPEMKNIYLRYDSNSFYFKNKSAVTQKVN
jgi:hypothetical protein